MKITWSILIVFILFSCNGRVQPDIKKEYEPAKTKVYQSTPDSFRKNFFLQIENKSATIYGWELNDMKDTIYFRSISEFEKDDKGRMNINMDKYELSKTRITENNVNDFKNNIGLNLPKLARYSNFTGQKLNNNAFDFKAFKHVYFSRFDEFQFRSIE